MATEISTYKGRVKRALLFKTIAKHWACVGRTTAWDDEEDPPAEDPETTVVEEPIVYVLPTQVSMAKSVIVGQGELIIDGAEYVLVDDEDAYDEDARFVYLQFNFDPDGGQPGADFRQHGVFVDLVPATGHENDLWLAPANVDDPGVLCCYDNHIVQELGLGEARQIDMVIEFR